MRPLPFILSSRVVTALLGAFILQGCGAYFNTYFNAQKAHNQGLRMQERRLELDPLDTVRVTTQERGQFNRAIVKSAKVLELWPDDEKYAPRAVFLMADSYLQMGDYDRAAQRYDEYIRFFPESGRVPLAEIRRARALFQDGQDLRAREALAEILRGNPSGEVRREALLLSARMQIAEGAPLEGLELYERLLEEGAFGSPENRADAHWQAAQLAYEAGEWERARYHAQAGNLGTMPARARYRNHKLAIQSLLEMERYRDVITEVNELYRQRDFRPVRNDLLVLRGRAHEGLGEWPSAERDYREAGRLGPPGAATAEAWYRIGVRFLDVESLEDSAKAYLDSAGRAGDIHVYGMRGLQKFRALSRLSNLRESDSAATATRALNDEKIMVLRARLAELDSIYNEVRRQGIPLLRPIETREDGTEVFLEDAHASVQEELASLKPVSPHRYPMMIAEVFLYDLQKPDSARVHLNRVAGDTVDDTVYTRRALYALAWVEREEFGNAERSDSLYRAMISRYPETEWAKQAEKNLGLEPTIRTREDLAREDFRSAERRQLQGENVMTRVIPAFRQVASRYPESVLAPRALFVSAYLLETIALSSPADQAARDSALAAYDDLAVRFPGTPYADMALAKSLPVDDEEAEEVERDSRDLRLYEGDPDEGGADESEGQDGRRGVEERLDPVSDDDYLY